MLSITYFKIFFGWKEPLVQWIFPSFTETGPKGHRSGLLALVKLICWAFLFPTNLGEMSTDPLTTQSRPWSPPPRRSSATSPGRLSKGSIACSGWGWRRSLVPRAILHDKFKIYTQINNSAQFHYVSIPIFLVMTFSFVIKKRASIPLAPCIPPLITAICQCRYT